MPPANSRSSSPPPAPPGRPGAQTPPSYLSALRPLESPLHQDVLNLAATLTTQAEDEAHEAQMRQLRASSHDRDRQLRQRDDLDQRERLRRVMSRLGRIHDPPTSSSYADRTPWTNSLYDWSPAHDDADEDELDQILAELRREQPNAHPDMLRVLGRSQLDHDRDRLRALSSRLLSSTHQPEPSADGSLRSAAILQSFRRHPRFSARTRDFLSRYSTTDRDAASSSSSSSRPSLLTSNESLRDRHSSTFAQRHGSDRLASLERERTRELRLSAELHRLERSASSNTASEPSQLEHAIRYLGRIRHSNSDTDSLHCALDAGFLGKDNFDEQPSDFVLDTASIPPPAETSWLAPGAVLSGWQHATNVTSTTTTALGSSSSLYRVRNADSPGPLPVRSSAHSHTSRSRGTRYPSEPEVITHQPTQDRWPVKVTIHTVDYSRMFLSATMEAYNVPSHSHQPNLFSLSSDSSSRSARTCSSITTYLEGEILDFDTHSLLTESFDSNPANDAKYWQKLPPFRNMKEHEIVPRLTSRRWFEQVLNKDWILMRWKERCFVKSLNDRSPSSSTATATPETTTSSTPAFGSVAVGDDTSSFLADALTPLESSNGSFERIGGSRLELSAALQNAEFTDPSCGLTINGFYYMCLRRANGELEGMYYDPKSTPYQCLKLESMRAGVFPAWGFR